MDLAILMEVGVGVQTTASTHTSIISIIIIISIEGSVN